jgi:hypothetical protein
MIMPKAKKASVKKAWVRKQAKKNADKEQLYTLEVFLISGHITEKFVKKNPVIARTIQIRGDQTLEQLHYAIFDAFGRFEEHLYEFQFGKGPMDPDGPRYVHFSMFETEGDEGNPPAGRVDKTSIGSLGLEIGRAFGYWFDFGDDWWHQIDVQAIEDTIPRGKFPKVIKRVGESPPQYPDEDDE